MNSDKPEVSGSEVEELAAKFAVIEWNNRHTLKTCHPDGAERMRRKAKLALEFWNEKHATPAPSASVEGAIRELAIELSHHPTYQGATYEDALIARLMRFVQSITPAPSASVEWLNEFHRINVARQHEAFAPAHSFLGLVACVAEEIGEMAGCVLGVTGEKKRKAHKTKEDILDGVADAITYLSLIADRAGCSDLRELLGRTFNMVSERAGSKLRVSHNATLPKASASVEEATEEIQTAAPVVAIGQAAIRREVELAEKLDSLQARVSKSELWRDLELGETNQAGDRCYDTVAERFRFYPHIESFTSCVNWQRRAAPAPSASRKKHAVVESYHVEPDGSMKVTHPQPPAPSASVEEIARNMLSEGGDNTIRLYSYDDQSRFKFNVRLEDAERFTKPFIEAVNHELSRRIQSALAPVELDRDLWKASSQGFEAKYLQAQAELEQAKETKDFTQRWYATRWARIKEWARNDLPENFKTELFSLIANEAKSPTDPISYHSGHSHYLWRTSMAASLRYRILNLKDIEIEQLRARLATAEADTKRLDWLESQRKGGKFNVQVSDWGVTLTSFRHGSEGIERHDTARAAIDAAHAGRPVAQLRKGSPDSPAPLR